MFSRWASKIEHWMKDRRVREIQSLLFTKVIEKRMVYFVDLFWLDSELRSFKKVYKAFTINELDRNDTISGGFRFCIQSKSTGRNEYAFLGPAQQRITKLSDCGTTNHILVALRLERNFQTDERTQTQYAVTIDPAIP